MLIHAYTAYTTAHVSIYTEAIHLLLAAVQCTVMYITHTRSASIGSGDRELVIDVGGDVWF
jgi:hypothetical protein